MNNSVELYWLSKRATYFSGWRDLIPSGFIFSSTMLRPVLLPSEVRFHAGLRFTSHGAKKLEREIDSSCV
jgi:hypothetical protein